ncbi:hypothetical protein EX895_005639 [Sporisorium graminicola]|uniref:F-box domain-containing protein n=1 Tax=Sporisorium graminicola TaxID=280036 RepID=A0A4U7KNN8_9BASI|nr:hypothetical protein EX895_005639 [Sporisorium graminicola]TKY85477.1 hypothetical protein EX895_005639 [Sporisorium graminicola]
MPDPMQSFRSVTACSPLSSPEEEEKQPVDKERGGRRQMLRSGTSGSITPLSAPSPEAVATSRKNSDSGSTSAASLQTSSTPRTDDDKRLDSSQKAVEAGQSNMTAACDARPTFHTERTNSSRFRSTDFPTATARSEALLSVASTPAADDLFRSPSQVSVASDADGYFTARPGSPAEANDLLSLSMLPTHSAAKTRSALRRERVSWSGRSYVTCASDNAAPELATATAASLSIHDEACYVDGEHNLSALDHNKRKGVAGEDGARRIDFLSLLPPELSLCIAMMLEEHTDLLSVSLVSRRWRALAMDQSLWRHLFFSRPGWAIREDAPLVVQHQAELQRIEARAKRTAAKEEAERLRRIQEQRKAASTSSLYLDRLAALKSWRETLHIPSFQHLAGLSLSNNSTQFEVDVDSGRPARPPMSPLRSPTAATGRFGLFLSPARAAPSTPAGARRAQEAAASTSYFGSNDTGSSTPLSRQGSVGSISRSRRASVESLHFAEVVEAEEFFAASLDWTRLFRDRFLLEQRWLRGHLPRKAENGEAGGGRQRGEGMARTASASSTNSEMNAPPAIAASASGTARPARDRRMFEPTKRFLRGHQDSVYCIRQDDGIGTGTAGKLVSGSRDRTIRVWDVETGTCKHILKGHAASVLSLQYDDQILVSVSSDGQVFVWDFASILATSKPSSSATTAEMPHAVIDPECGALVHDKADRVHCVLRDHSSAVLDVVFDENWIVTGSKDATVRVWRRSDIPLSSASVNSPSPVAWRKFSHTGPVNAVDLQGSHIVSASGEGSMYLWNLESGEKLHRFSGHSKGLACIVFKGSTLVSGSNDQTIRVWDTVSGKCTHVLGLHHMLVRTVAYCPVRRLVVSGGYDRMIKLWRIDEVGTQHPQEEEERTQPTATSQISSAVDEQQQEEQGETAEGPAVGTCLRDIRCHRARIFDVDFNTTRIVSASEDHLICITSFGGQGIDASLFA